MKRHLNEDCVVFKIAVPSTLKGHLSPERKVTIQHAHKDNLWKWARDNNRNLARELRGYYFQLDAASKRIMAKNGILFLNRIYLFVI